MSGDIEKDFTELEAEYDGLNEGFRIASDKLDAIKKLMEEAPPLIMPLLDSKNKNIQKFVQDLTDWGRKVNKVLYGPSSEVNPE